MSQQFGEAF